MYVVALYFNPNVGKITLRKTDFAPLCNIRRVT